ncbi:hypothetical protein Hanom_Chr09g00771431 [Helianthus anomalus]
MCEVQGLFKLVPIAELSDIYLGHMKWIKAYQDHQVDLGGDQITEGRLWPFQMLYEYGIMSTYLQGIKDQYKIPYEYASSSNHLTFCVPSRHKRNKIQGLKVRCLYKSSKARVLPGYTTLWYEPRVDEDVVWLSYWPIGNILDAGDEVTVGIYVDQKMIVSVCGARLLYMDDGEVEEKEYCDNNTMKKDEVIGGDLSEFEVTTGGYYLSRRCDIFGSETPSRLKEFFGDNINYPGKFLKFLIELSYGCVH